MIDLEETKCDLLSNSNHLCTSIMNSRIPSSGNQPRFLLNIRKDSFKQNFYCKDVYIIFTILFPAFLENALLCWTRFTATHNFDKHWTVACQDPQTHKGSRSLGPQYRSLKGGQFILSTGAPNSGRQASSQKLHKCPTVKWNQAMFKRQDLL